MERLTGIPVSPGVVVGRAVVLTGHADVVRFPIPPERVGHELEQLEQARARSHAQLQDIRDRLASGPGHDLAPLFDAQLLILDDSMFMGRARDIVRHDRVNAAWAVHRAYEELCSVFATVEDPYLRERDNDVADVAGRLRMNLRRAGGWAADLLRDVEGPAVLIADELTASLAAQMDWSRVLGFATDAGGRTHHTAILARSLHVPAVVGLRDLSRRVRPGTPVVIDGTSGTVTIDASPATIEDARRRAAHRRPAVTPRPAGEPAPTTQTADGVPIRLEANLERPDDVPAVIEAGAEGIGLVRTEFLLAERSPERLPEDHQFEIYRDLLRAAGPRRVTVRTFDLDERQLQRWAGRDRRDQRAGRRGIRLGLAYPDVLRPQLRALLRAAPAGQLRVMFPFVTSVEEMRQARAIVDDVARELDRPTAVPIGAMVEVPSAALAADMLARDAAFFTVGTNDLIQYALAVDRTDERVSDLYEPLHPAVIRLLRTVRRAARRGRIDVSICGEMASDPAVIGLLVGLGFREFSMTPSAIPVVRRLLQDVRADDARRIAGTVLRLPTAADIEQYLFDALASPNRAPRS